MKEPLYRVAVDLIGPIAPVSKKGNRYILTIIDYAARYSEAIALPKIETERVAEALLEAFVELDSPRKYLVTGVYFRINAKSMQVGVNKAAFHDPI